ncbi:DUF6293 family protein [Haloprofundus salinisoli]|uniref:HFX_2341 family transcriptional regulator domain-containing protein n=1 Tax=Haloprofundus salinisoli TaxID=2876193 RepID=UPI001CCD1FC4|nr:DUF6293 family protein [Haloprofundus salinisoli]
MTPNDSIPLRVQVVPLGFEYARFRDPVFRWRADKVVAIEHVDAADIDYLDAFLAELEGNDRIDLELRTCDIFDLYDALGSIAGTIDDHADDEVFVNLSGGSKVTAIAGMIACMATGATPFYAKPDYGPDGRAVPAEPLHDAVESVFALPTYPIDAPSPTLVAFLSYIGAETDEATGPGGRSRGPNKKDLIDFAREHDFDFVATSEATTEKAYYRLLDSRVLDPLLARGYVETERIGRRTHVTLTSDGENALRAFRHLVT